MREQNEFQVEPAHARDLPEVIALTEASTDGPHWPYAAWDSYVSGVHSERCAGLLIVRDASGRLAGWVAGSVVAETAEVDFLLVDAARRGKGLGRLLLERWLKWARNAGAGEVFLEVRASNVAARQLYLHAAFSVAGERKAYYSDPVEDAVVMRRALPGLGHG